MTSTVRAAAENGIWLCQLCAKLVDNDPSTYTPELLRSWKELAEDRARREIQGRVRDAARDHEFGKLFGVPTWPPHFIPRAADMAALRARVVIDSVSRVAVTGVGRTGMHGMGGIGKSVLAAALAHDEEVRRAFPDGIHWLTLGQRPNLLGLQNQLLHQMAPSSAVATTVTEAKDQLREKLEGRKALVILDDVWTVDAADAFCVTPHASFLITTRNSAVLLGVGADEYRVDVLPLADAVAMLAAWSGTAAIDEFKGQAQEVAIECGRLPLALSAIGAMVRQRPNAWADALERLRRVELDRFERTFPGYPYPHLLRAIDVSIEALDDGDRQRYLDLAVFPEDVPIPERPLQDLWRLDAIDTRDCMTRLATRSLAAMRLAGDSNVLVLHDLQRDLIRKRSETAMRSLHERLVAAWTPLPQPSDDYAWRWIGYHLVGAERRADLAQLLLDFSYMAAKIRESGPLALIDDYAYVEEDDEALRLLRTALRFSSDVISDEAQLTSQLFARFSGTASPALTRLLDEASLRTKEPWLRSATASLTQPGGALQHILPDVRGETFEVILSSDERRVISVSAEGAVTVWDLATGRIVWTTDDPQETAVTAVSSLADGRIVIASTDGTMRLWEQDDVAPSELTGHQGLVQCLAATSDARFLISASADNTIRLWDLTTGLPVRAMVNYRSTMRSAVVLDDDRHAVLLSDEDDFCVWDFVSHRVVRAMRCDGSPSSALVAHSDGESVVFAVSGWIYIWNTRTGLLRRHGIFTGHIESFAVSSDLRRALVASNMSAMTLWDLGSGALVGKFETYTSSVSRVAATADLRTAVSASTSGVLKVWDTTRPDVLRAPGSHRGAVTGVRILPDGERALSAGDESLRLWHIASGGLLHVFSDGDFAAALEITPDARRAIVASDPPGQIYVVDLRNWSISEVFATRQGQLSSQLAVSSDGRAVAYLREDGLTVLPLDSETAPVSYNVENVEGLLCVASSSDPDGFLAGSYTGDVYLFDRHGDRVLRHICLDEGVESIISARRGRCVISGLESGRISFASLDDGREVFGLEGHDGPITGLSLTQDGKHLVSSSQDRTVRVWDMVRRTQTAVFAAEEVLSCCAVARNDVAVVAGDVSGALHFLKLT